MASSLAIDPPITPDVAPLRAADAARPASGWRDRWAWVVALSALPLFLASLGAHLGEPFADDYDYLHHALLSGKGNWLDGGGCAFYWRPLSRQLWFRALGPTILAHPAWVTVLQATMAGLAALLLYRALRTRWPAPWAAAAATFPFLFEGARMLVAWTTNVEDLGALLFAAVALHEASRRRLATSVAAIAAGLLCKEPVLIVAVLLPWTPLFEEHERRTRLRWTAAIAALVVIWGALYAFALQHSGMLMGRDRFQDPTILATPWAIRAAWSVLHQLEDAFGLAAVSRPVRWTLVSAFGLMAVVAMFRMVTDHSTRVRVASQRGWILCGLVWFLAVGALLAEIYPEWRSYRGAFSMAGLALACVPVFGAVHGALLGALVVLRLIALAASPGPASITSDDPETTAGSIEYPEMARLQRVVGDTRSVLLDAYPRVPAGTRIGRHLMPHLSLYAFGTDKALQVWYRDTSLHWMTSGEFLANRQAPPLTIVEYQPPGGRRVALVNPEAMRALLAAGDSVNRGRFGPGLALLARAETLQADSAARVFFGIAAATRARALAGSGLEARALREAVRAVRLWPLNPEPRRIAALMLARRGRYEEALVQVDALLAIAPGDTSARTLRDQLRVAALRR